MANKGTSTAVLGALAGALMLAGCSADAPAGMPLPSATETSSAETDREDAPVEATTEPVADIRRDPVLATQLKDLITEDLPPLSLLVSESVAAQCGAEAGGCYNREAETIFVEADWTDFRRPELLAHEYLHYVWERDGLEDDVDLAAALDDAYGDPEGLGALVPSWQEGYVEDDGTILPTELFSYACTGMSEAQLPAVIARRCVDYLEMDRLPVGQTISATDLIDEITALRAASGLAPLEQNPHAVAASQARAELFTPHSQVPLSEYPESVTTHLNAGCAPSTYGVRLTRPGDAAQIVTALDSTVSGALSSPSSLGMGIATKEYEYIDTSAVFDERTIRVNATLVVVTVCR